MADLPGWVRADGDTIAALERQAVHDAGVEIRSSVALLLAAVIAAWHRGVGASGDVAETSTQQTAVASIQQQVATGLAAIATADVVAAVWRQVERATTLGVHLGARQAGIGPVAASVSPVIRDVLNELDATMSARLEIGQKLASTATTLPRLTQAVAAGASAAHSAERTASWATVRAASDAVRAQAREAGAQVLWVAERNACLYCLAQSGHLADEGGGFDPARAFGAKPLAAWPNGELTGPPRHPFCRCHLVVYRGHAGPGIALPDALKREASRSVVLGLALPSESQTERARAAQRLVDAGTGAPPTVLARTRRQLVAGAFTTRSR